MDSLVPTFLPVSPGLGSPFFGFASFVVLAQEIFIGFRPRFSRKNSLVTF